MKKSFWKLLSVFFVFSLAQVSFADVIELNREAINLGRLASSDRSPGELVVQVLRTEQTPEEVTLKVSYDYETRVCARWVQDRYWVPGICRNVWDGRHWRRVCTGGHYEYRSVCAAYRNEIRTTNEDFKLDFEKAYNLGNGRSEEFELHFLQEGYQSKDVEWHARVLTSEGEYELKHRGDKIKFKAQD